jgi:crossover junction endodeoxyribonuclease RuvC
VRVLGIDPGTAVTGFGVVETANGRLGPGRLIECGVIRFARRSSLPRRLHELHAGIVELIDRHHRRAALEDAFITGTCAPRWCWDTRAAWCCSPPSRPAS